MIVRATGGSHRGQVREGNDDHYCIGHHVEQCALTALSFDADAAFFRDYGLLCAVADGMGGYEGGAIASRVALETLSGYFYAEKRTGATVSDLKAGLERCFTQMQRTLELTLRREAHLARAGSTLAGIALLAPDVLAVFHCGDSRVLRASGGYLRPLTLDHTPVAADIAQGRLSEEQAATMPVASQLTRSLGIEGDSAIEIGDESAWTSSDTFLMGSDGWHGLGRGLSQRALRETLRQHPKASPEEITRLLVSEAVRLDGNDNATLVMIRFEEEPDGGSAVEGSAHE